MDPFAPRFALLEPRTAPNGKQKVSVWLTGSNRATGGPDFKSKEPILSWEADVLETFLDHEEPANWLMLDGSQAHREYRKLARKQMRKRLGELRNPSTSESSMPVGSLFCAQDFVIGFFVFWLTETQKGACWLFLLNKSLQHASVEHSNCSGSGKGV